MKKQCAYVKKSPLFISSFMIFAQASANPQQTPSPKKNVARKPSTRKTPTKKTPTGKSPLGKLPAMGKPMSKKSENLEEKYKMLMQTDGAVLKKLVQVRMMMTVMMMTTTTMLMMMMMMMMMMMI